MPLSGRLKSAVTQQLRRVPRLREILDARAWVSAPPDYLRTGMALWGRNPEFLHDRTFLDAYRRGMNSGHHFTRPDTPNGDLGMEWQVHVACWAAWHGRQLPGDFVECGVNTGILSLAICEFIDFNQSGKDFFLFDTFAGIPERQMSEVERDARLDHNQRFYRECYDLAVANFAPFPRAHLVRGEVPDSLSTVNVERVCYLSLDMNVAAPEVAALEFFWDRLSPGAPILFDDYGHKGYETQKHAMDAFARQKGLRVLNLPTGQGLLLKA